MKRLLKILLWTAGILVALLAIASIAGGPVAKNYVNRHGPQLLGRQTHVDHVGLNLLTGRVKIRSLSVYEEDGATPFAGFDTLDVRVSLLPLAFRTVSVRHITLAGLHANLLQRGDRFNFSSILEHFGSDDNDDTPSPSRWTIRLRNLRLAHANLHYRDELNHKELSLPDVNLRVPGFTVGGNEKSEGGLTLGFADGGQMNIDAHYDATLDRYHMQAAIDDFDLENIADMLSGSLRFKRLHGILQARLKADGEVKHPLQSQLGGQLQLTRLDLQADQGKVAEMDTLDIQINNINLEKNNFDLKHIHLYGLSAHFEQWDGHNTLSDLLPPNGDTAAAQHPSTTEKKNRINLSVADLQVARCALSYTDHTLPDRLVFPVKNISLSATNISTHGANNARLRATLPGGGRLTLKWQGMLGDWKRFQELSLDINSMELKQLNPLVVAYTGRGFNDGILGISSQLTIQNSLLDNQNHIDIYKATVSKRHRDITPRASIPLKTALYVLKDRNDKILIDMPVSGNIDSPEFNYMKLVWKTLGQLLVKVATSPARALGNALGYNSENLEFIAIDPTQTTLTSQQYHQLSQLAAITRENSLMVLHLQHSGLMLSDSTAAQHFDNEVTQYLKEQQIDDKQLIISNAETDDPKHRTGYTVSSSMLIEEE